MYKQITSSRYFNLFIGVVLFLITSAAYFNILQNKLFFDDEELIYKNSYIQNLSYLPKYFTQNMTAGAGKISNMYRPLLLLSLAFDYRLWKLNPAGYHLTSIMLHFFNGLLVYLVLQKLFNKKFISFFTSLLFIIHPVQTEAVAYASGRTDPLYTYFLLGCLLITIQFFTSRRFNFMLFTGSAAFFIFSILSKESGIILPFLIILMLIFMNLKIKSRRPILLLGLFLTVDLIYIFLRFTKLNFLNSFNFYDVPTLYSSHLEVRLFTFSKVFFNYLLVLFFPKDLIVARKPEIITSFLNPWVLIFSFFVIVAIFIIAKYWKFNKIYFFAFGWFIITILPVSGIIPINNIEAEHYLYLPSVAVFSLVSFLIYKIWSNSRNYEIKRLFCVLVIMAVLLLFFRTVVRNYDWKDPESFYALSLKQSPWNISMRHNQAMTYAENGKTNEAILIYKQVISLNDRLPNPHHNLANIYRKSGLYDEAESEYLKALEVDPNFYFSYFALSQMYQDTNQTEKYLQILNRIKNIKKLEEIYSLPPK